MISSILGDRPFKASQQYEDYLKENKKMAEELKPTLFSPIIDHL